MTSSGMGTESIQDDVVKVTICCRFPVQNNATRTSPQSNHVTQFLESSTEAANVLATRLSNQMMS